MRFRLFPFLFGAAFLAMIAFSDQAKADSDGWTTADVNMRTCPSIGCPRILVIPRGALVSVQYCNSWCRVRYRGWSGYVYGLYIVFAPYYPPVYPRIYEVPPPFIYVPPPDYRAPIYRPPRVAPPPRIYRPPPPPAVRPPPLIRPEVTPHRHVQPRAPNRFRPPPGPLPESGAARPRREHVRPLRPRTGTVHPKRQERDERRDGDPWRKPPQGVSPQ